MRLRPLAFSSLSSFLPVAYPRVSKCAFAKYAIIVIIARNFSLFLSRQAATDTIGSVSSLTILRLCDFHMRSTAFLALLMDSDSIEPVQLSFISER